MFKTSLDCILKPIPQHKIKVNYRLIAHHVGFLGFDPNTEVGGGVGARCGGIYLQSLHLRGDGRQLRNSSSSSLKASLKLAWATRPYLNKNKMEVLKALPRTHKSPEFYFQQCKNSFIVLNILFLCMNILPASMSVHDTCTWRSEQKIVVFKRLTSYSN